MQLLTKAEIKKLIEGVWSGEYSAANLPFWLFDKISGKLEDAASQGWGNPLGSGAIEDVELEKAMQENVFYFAAHKEAHELKDLNALFIASKNKYDYVKAAMLLDEKYNFHWFNTEYNVTKRIARSGREWRRIEATKDIYPKLKFVAVQDANTRAEHAALHGIIRPVGDAFWKTYFPPLSWNCRCRTERVMDGKSTPLKDIEKPEVIEQFRDRVTDSKKIWHESHPYFHDLTDKAKQQVEMLVAQKYANSYKKKDVN